eukprot:CAMPEP_0171316416 /NCGR_PEP_ID=MMETSP0816-20121228/72645_1 /TAXON_ID=420281 /ORGANISM="Proboscia inermis, Strain CCAP1064/1" /LENGTH=36 /DNA_ID= /DNA_START= /DNA_END= /DNA_ORIENTATION=
MSNAKIPPNPVTAVQKGSHTPQRESLETSLHDMKRR